MYTNKIKLPSILEEILSSLTTAGIKPVVVGGCIRDSLLNISCKDYDIELYNTNSLDEIESILKKFGTVKQVGKSFGVLILSTSKYDFDFAIARTEKKTGLGHNDFEVTSNGNLTYKEAALRRDFTINAIAFDFITKTILDPYDGLKDLENKKLKHINNKTFVEDPLRVYRAVQFSSRFEFSLDDETFQLCLKMVKNNDLEHLAKERVYEEFKKIFLKSRKPSIGFSLIKQLGILKYFPELEALIGCQQDKEYHPEGDVWIHTLMTIDELAKILKDRNIEDEYKKLYLFYAILCHDLGKPYCTKKIDGRITSHKHESLGVEPTISFLEKLTSEKKFIEIVCSLVKNHLAPFQLYLAKSSQKAVKRLSLKVNIEDLCLVCLADCLGRDIKDKQKCPKATSWLLSEARKLNISNEAIKPIVQGRDLINLGFKPSKKFKNILDYAFDLQIEENMDKKEILKNIKENFIIT